MGPRAPLHLVFLLALSAAATAGNASPGAPTEAASGFLQLVQVRGVERHGETRAIPIDQMPLSSGVFPEALARAVRTGDTEMVRRILARGFVPEGGLLIEATRGSKTEIVRLLLDGGAKVNARDDETRTALIYAAQAGNAEIVRMLLAKGANPNARTDYPWELRLHGTPRQLYPDNQMSALMYAAQGGHTQVVAALAAAGAEVNAEAYHDETALMYAAEKGGADTVAKLLELGADLQAKDSIEIRTVFAPFESSRGSTALIYAARGKNTATAKVLVAEYTRRNKPIEKGDEVLYYALHAGADVELVRGLSERGIDTRKAYILPTAAQFSSTEVFKYLLNKVPDEDIRGGRLDPPVGASPGRIVPGALIGAALGSSLPKVKLVAERGANINARESNGQNALYYAVYKGDADVVGYLLDKGSEVNVVGDISLGGGDTALALAVKKDRLDMVKQLLARGADVDLKGKTRQSALDIARESGRAEILALFASTGRTPAGPR